MVTWRGAFPDVISSLSNISPVYIPKKYFLSSQLNSCMLERLSKLLKPSVARSHDFVAINLISDVLAIVIYQHSMIFPASTFAERFGIVNSATRFFTAYQFIVTACNAPTKNTSHGHGSRVGARLAKFDISSFILGTIEVQTSCRATIPSDLREIQTVFLIIIPFSSNPRHITPLGVTDE